MRFSHQHKFLLISNWRCGCSTMANLFAPYSEFTYKTQAICQEQTGQEYGKVVHWPAKKIKFLFKKRGWDYDKYVKIITVRNPWARIVSLFFYKYGRKKSIKNVKAKFNDFVLKELPRWKRGLRNRWITQEMIHDQRGRKIVDYIVQIEHLQRDLEPIIKKHFPTFKIDYQTQANSTKHAHYSTYYTPKTRKIIAKMFIYEIKKFKYKFEIPKPAKITANPLVLDVTNFDQLLASKINPEPINTHVSIDSLTLDTTDYDRLLASKINPEPNNTDGSIDSLTLDTTDYDRLLVSKIDPEPIKTHGSSTDYDRLLASKINLEQPSIKIIITPDQDIIINHATESKD